MTTEQEALRCAGFLKPGAIIPVDIETTALLVNELRKLVAEREEYRAAMRRALEAALHVTDCASRNEHGELVLLGSLYNPEHLDAAITHLRQRLEGTT